MAIDWEPIRRIYRTGLYSNVEISKHFGISESSIRNRAKKEAWPRDLVDEIAKATDRKLLADAVKELQADLRREERAQREEEARQAVKARHKPDETATAAQELILRREREQQDVLENGSIIEQASEVCAAVVSVHRRKAKQAADLCQKLFVQLTEAAEERDEIVQDIIDAADAEIDAAGDDKYAKAEALKKRARMLKAVGLPTHAATIRDLSIAFKTFVGVEREAYGLDKDKKPGDGSGLQIHFDVHFG